VIPPVIEIGYRWYSNTPPGSCQEGYLAVPNRFCAEATRRRTAACDAAQAPMRCRLVQ
jgi:hypothetical protein